MILNKAKEILKEIQSEILPPSLLSPYINEDDDKKKLRKLFLDTDEIIDTTKLLEIIKSIQKQIEKLCRIGEEQELLLSPEEIRILVARIASLITYIQENDARSILAKTKESLKNIAIQISNTTERGGWQNYVKTVLSSCDSINDIADMEKYINCIVISLLADENPTQEEKTVISNLQQIITNLQKSSKKSSLGDSSSASSGDDCSNFTQKYLGEGSKNDQSQVDLATREENKQPNNTIEGIQQNNDDALSILAETKKSLNGMEEQILKTIQKGGYNSDAAKSLIAYELIDNIVDMERKIRFILSFFLANTNPTQEEKTVIGNLQQIITNLQKSSKKSSPGDSSSSSNFSQPSAKSSLGDSSSSSNFSQPSASSGCDSSVGRPLLYKSKNNQSQAEIATREENKQPNNSDMQQRLEETEEKVKNLETRIDKLLSPPSSSPSPC